VSEPASQIDTDADVRAGEVEAQLTDDERFSLLTSVMGESELFPFHDERFPPDVPRSAGYAPGIARLGVPALRMSDAGLGVTNPGYRPGDTATAFPAGLALAASFHPELAHSAGAAVGREARTRGFNVLLGPGINLARDPRNGRNFEYLSEDPLLSGTMAAHSIAGIQQQGVISTVKHYSLNCNETNRHWLDAVIDPAAHREADLLAFEIAVERAQPGAVMTAYNKVNGEYASRSDVLINDILKGRMRHRGWVMSDWGGTPSWECALNGLDQECGVQIDAILWQAEAFTGPLQAAYTDGRLSKRRLSEMVHRILRSMFAVGVDRWETAPAPDMVAHNGIALDIARQGTVLLQNRGLLPLAPESAPRVAVIGGYAQVGVPTGCGSSAVVPPGGYASVIPIGAPGFTGAGRNLYLLPSCPLDELRKRLPHSVVEFDPGLSPAEAALVARRADIAIVFGIRVEGEGLDSADLSLPWGQDAVISAVADVNPNTVVVLETGNPVGMPWRKSVNAILQAWYPGQAGGQAIAEIIVGEINPSGRLPVTFPVDLAQTPRPELPGLDAPRGMPTTIHYSEGSDVGYRWFAKKALTPMFAFGHGLSYTSFNYRDLTVHGGETVTAHFTVSNTGERAGAEIPQLYLTAGPHGQLLRLLGYHRVELGPAESRRVGIEVDPRLLASYDGSAGSWRIDGGGYAVAVSASAVEPKLTADVELIPRVFGR
jgi:beta-glucosidase